MSEQEPDGKNVGWSALLGRAACLLGGHRYDVLQEFGGGMRRVQCSRCGGDWGMNDRAEALLHWDAELEDLARCFKPVRRPKFSDGSRHEWPNVD